MSLAPGTRFGPYEILGPLGAGGMGEVYRARDARLGRDVAIKVLPEAFAQDADRQARFEREARAIAALSHPNILAIHDFGGAYVVTELLEGTSLRERMKEPLPVRKAVDVAVQVARGLAAAHSKGIVHRDLKPENIFLLADGQVKILDFGLASQIRTHSGATETGVALTDPGVVMGTVGYMSPEQVRGQAVDARTDLFALGAVLYEMLSGQRAFRRDTAADTMSAILSNDPPDLIPARPEVPPGLERIVRHCLEKNPAERFQSARDVAFALEAPTTSSSGAARVEPQPSPARRPLTRWALMTAACLVCVVAGFGLARFFTTKSARTSFEPVTWDGQWIYNARFLPDGQTLVYSAENPTTGAPELFIKRAASPGSERLGQPETLVLATSSKGEIAVLTHPQFRAVDIFEGTLARMTPDSAPRPWVEHAVSADWSPDGANLAVVRASGATNTLEYPIDHALYRLPVGLLSDVRVSPDGAEVAFMEHNLMGDNGGWVKVVDKTGVVRTLAGRYSGENGLAWSTDAKSLFFSASPLGGNNEAFVVNAHGTPVVRPILAGPTGMHVHDVSPSGRILVTQDDLRISTRGRLLGEPAERDLSWLDGSFGGSFIHDQQSLIFGDVSRSAGPDYAVAVRNIATSKVSRLGEGNLMATSPDEKWVAALVSSKNQVVLYPIGAGAAVSLSRGPITSYRNFCQWLSETRLVTCGGDAAGKSKCYAQDVPRGTPVPMTPAGIVMAMVSPDGETMVAQNDTGEVLVGPTSGPLVPQPKLSVFDNVVRWTTDSRAVILHAFGKPPMRVEEFDVRRGTRKQLKELSPPDSASVNVMGLTSWIDGGKSYVYWYTRQNSRLYLVSGVLSD